MNVGVIGWAWVHKNAFFGRQKKSSAEQMELRNGGNGPKNLDAESFHSIAFLLHFQFHYLILQNFFLFPWPSSDCFGLLLY